MATNQDLSHLPMLYPDLVDKAMRQQEPLREVRSSGSNREIYTAVQYDPENEVVWRCYIDHDTHPDYDSKPSVHFSKCYPNSDAEVMQKWTSLATGRLGGPQKLGPWESMFTVFNAALGIFHDPGRADIDRRADTGGDSEDIEQ